MLNFDQILYWILKWKSTETEDLSLELLFFLLIKKEKLFLFSVLIFKNNLDWSLGYNLCVLLQSR